MTKEFLIETIRNLINIKIKYYRLLNVEEIIIDEVVSEVYYDIMEHMEEDMDEHFPFMNEYDLLNLLVGDDNE